MKIFNSLRPVFMIMLIMVICAPVMAGQSVRIRQQNGSYWRGEIGNQVEVTYFAQRIERTFVGRLIKYDPKNYIIVEGDMVGVVSQNLIPLDDVISIRGLDDAAFEKATPALTQSALDSNSTAASTESTPGVFFLPLDGPVGTNIRHEELEKIAEHADKFGPHQIIVLEVHTNGGSSFESENINNTLEEIKKRHRVVAWIRKAISAGCQLAMGCNEIYFTTEGTAGSVTTWNPGTKKSIKGKDLRDAMDHLAEIAERNGYSKYIAYSMKTNSAMCSYTKDPVTGEVTFYNDKSGEVLLSDENSNLTFNSDNALDCGFSKGTADTTEDLAKLLNLPEWREIDDYGRKLARKWHDTVEQAEREIPLLGARYEYKNASQDIVVQLGTKIGIIKKLIRWHDRCPNVAQSKIPPKEQLEREVKELQKTLADIRKSRRGG